MHRFTVQMTHRPERNGELSSVSHAPFNLPLEMVMYGWVSALERTENDRLTAANLAVVNLTADYAREMHVGETVIDVELERIGGSSLTFAIAVSQAGHPAATVRVVLVRVDPEARGASVRFSPEERETLQRLQRTDSSATGGPLGSLKQV